MVQQSTCEDDPLVGLVFTQDEAEDLVTRARRKNWIILTLTNDLAKYLEAMPVCVTISLPLLPEMYIRSCV
jgi:hypothetical protein